MQRVDAREIVDGGCGCCTAALFLGGGLDLREAVRHVCTPRVRRIEPEGRIGDAEGVEPCRRAPSHPAAVLDRPLSPSPCSCLCPSLPSSSLASPRIPF